MGTPGQANYAAAKAGLIGLTKSHGARTGPSGYSGQRRRAGPDRDGHGRGPVRRERRGYVGQIPLKRIGTAREVAEVVRFLASEGASYITGQVIHVNGGLYM